MEKADNFGFKLTKMKDGIDKKSIHPYNSK